MSDLLTPLTIKNVTIPNRIVFPPVVCFGWAQDDGLVTARHKVHYPRKAEGGCGLIIVEASCVSEKGRINRSQLGIWSDEQVDGFRRIAEGCHARGVPVLVQIHHAGCRTSPEIADPSLGPSDFTDEKNTARAMTLEEIAETQDAYVKAALRVKRAGFDGIELHGAHGFLISQFFSPRMNRRTDRYGGSRERRAAFVLEIIEKLKREVADDDFIIGCRIGANEPDLENGIANARLLEEAGVELLHVSRGIGGGEEPAAPSDFPHHWITYCGAEIRKHVNVPVIAVYHIRTPGEARWLVENAVDLVAIGRGILVDHDWAKKARSGEEIITCLDCKPRCHWFTESDKCPRFDHELYDVS
jgi:NADPH2 dehydrogenase